MRMIISSIFFTILMCIACNAYAEQAPIAKKNTPEQELLLQDTYSFDTNIEVTFFIEPLSIERMKREETILNARLILKNVSDNTQSINDIFVKIHGYHVNVLYDDFTLTIDNIVPLRRVISRPLRLSFDKQVIVDFKVKTHLYSRVLSQTSNPSLGIQLNASTERVGLRGNFINKFIELDVEFPKVKLGDVLKPRLSAEELFDLPKEPDRTVTLTPGAKHNVVSRFQNLSNNPQNPPYSIRFSSENPAVSVKPDADYARANSAVISLEPDGYLWTEEFAANSAADIPFTIELSSSYNRAEGPVNILLEVIDEEFGLPMFRRIVTLYTNGPVFEYQPLETVHRAPNGDKDNNQLLNVGDTLVQRGLIKNVGNMHAQSGVNLVLDNDTLKSALVHRFQALGETDLDPELTGIRVAKPLRIGQSIEVELEFTLNRTQLSSQFAPIYIVSPQDVPDANTRFEHLTTLSRCEQPTFERSQSFELLEQNDFDGDGVISPGDVVEIKTTHKNICGLPLSYQPSVYLGLIGRNYNKIQGQVQDVIPQANTAIVDAQGRGGFVRASRYSSNFEHYYHKIRALSETINDQESFVTTTYARIPENYSDPTIAYEYALSLDEGEQNIIWSAMRTVIPVKQKSIDDLVLNFDWELTQDNNNNQRVDQGDIIEYTLTVTNKLSSEFDKAIRFKSARELDPHQKMVKFLGYSNSNVDVKEGWYEHFTSPSVYELKAQSIDAGGSVKFTYSKQVSLNIPSDVSQLYETLNVVMDDNSVSRLPITIPLGARVNNEQANQQAAPASDEFPFTEANGKRKCLFLYQCHVKGDVRNVIRETALNYSPNEANFCETVKNSAFANTVCVDEEFKNSMNHNFGLPSQLVSSDCKAIKDYQEQLKRRFDNGEETYPDEQKIQQVVQENMMIMLSPDLNKTCTTFTNALGLGS